MTIEKFTGGKDLPPLSDQAVLNFLRQSPDFFLRHPSALSELSLPHESGQAVSLIERQIDILRERNMTMRRRMNELLQAESVAQHNQDSGHRDPAPLTLDPRGGPKRQS